MENIMRTTIDLGPLYRSAIGFDRMAKLLNNTSVENKPSYPPYNIELIDENQYRITMAVAGFTETEIEMTSEQNTLTVAGKQQAEQGKQFLYQGIAARNFERKFQLDEHVKVTSASLSNGLLHIELEREIPEAMKPRKITISGGSSDNLLEQHKNQAA
jgi:molecular chaperone IbpA